MLVQSVTGGGTHAAAFVGFVFVVLSGGILLGLRGGIAVVALCVATIFGILYAQVNELLPPSMVHNTPYTVVLAHVFFYSYVIMFVYFYARSMKESLHRARTELTQRQRIEDEHRKSLYELGERVKELTAVHTATHILQRDQNDLQKTLDEVLRILPPAFQYPDSTEARIFIGELAVATPGFVASSALLRQEFTAEDGSKGGIEVVYTQPQPEAHQGPFLREEVSLLITLADLLRTAYDRRQAMAALRESEAQMKFFAEATFEGIVIHADGKVIDTNEQNAKLLGYSVSEMIGMPVQNLVAPESRSDAKKRVAEHRTEPYELLALRKDGSKFPMEVRITNTMVNGKEARVIVARDLTERKKAEAQIRESEARYRELVDTAKDTIFTLSKEGKFISLNPSFGSVSGWGSDEWSGKSYAELIHPDDLLGVTDMVKQVFSGKSAPPTEFRMRTKTGDLLNVEFTAVPQVRGTEVVGLLGIARDVTERKKLEEQVRRSQRMDSIGALAGGIAHDLNNVLAPILLSLDVLTRRTADEHIKKIVETLGRSAHRGKDIVKQVLTFARGSGQEFAPQQVRHHIREIESFIKQTLPKSIELKAILPKELPAVLGDTTQIHQVLLNLCVNARDAMPNGGTLTISASHEKLSGDDVKKFQGAQEGEYVLLSVQDTGMGIPPEIREKIFEPFFTTKEVGKGTGLGLSTVFSIVRDHKGFMDIQSEVGRGTEFNVYLPAIVRAEQAEDKDQRKELPRGNGEKVLVVDDELSILQIARETLETFGYTVLTAADGVEATTLLAGMKRGEVSAVVTDMNMPKMGGGETVKLLRLHDPSLKIVITSGSEDEENQAKLEGFKIEARLAKPYTAEQLLTALHDALNGKNSQ